MNHPTEDEVRYRLEHCHVGDAERKIAESWLVLRGEAEFQRLMHENKCAHIETLEAERAELNETLHECGMVVGQKSPHLQNDLHELVKERDTLRAERERTEAALRKWCAEWDEVCGTSHFAKFMRQEFANRGLWREPAEESPKRRS